MNGIDVASYQTSLELLAISYDFVAIKATQGDYYVNPDCDAKFQKAKAEGKRRLVYHFIDFNVDIELQAHSFVDNCRGYIRDAIFALDWEGHDVERVADALRFLQIVEDLIGYKPAIYMSEYVENNYDWSSVVSNDNGLWIAKYADYEIDNNYDTSNAGRAPVTVHWPFYFMWQWTSKGILNGYANDLDCDIFYGDADTWDKYAGVQPPAPTPATETPVAPVEDSTPTPTDTTPPAEAVEPEPTPPTEATPAPQPVEQPAQTAAEPAATSNPSWLAIIAAVIVAIYNRLRGLS